MRNLISNSSDGLALSSRVLNWNQKLHRVALEPDINLR
jgi:hypothetical protein